VGELPRSTIEELIARWALARLRLLVVEGTSDQRALQLFQREKTCPASLSGLDIWPAEAIDLPSQLLTAVGVSGGGARGRVIALARATDSGEGRGGFYGLIDRDLDDLRQINLETNNLSYTDGGCLFASLWTPDVLNRMLVQYLCDDAALTTGTTESLFTEINAACGMLSSIRLAAAENPSWGLSLHRSQNALGVSRYALAFDVESYLGQCRLPKPIFKLALGALSEARTRVTGREMQCINSHDLVWICTVLFRELTSGSRHLVSERLVEASLLAFGLACADLSASQSLEKIALWADAE
jgi:hypothetical protein